MTSLDQLIRSLPPTLPLYPGRSPSSNSVALPSAGISSSIGPLSASPSLDDWVASSQGYSLQTQLEQFNQKQLQHAMQFQLHKTESNPGTPPHPVQHLPSSSPQPPPGSAAANDGMSDEDFSRFLMDTEALCKQANLSPLSDPTPLLSPSGPVSGSAVSAGSSAPSCSIISTPNNKLLSNSDLLVSTSTSESWMTPNSHPTTQNVKDRGPTSMTKKRTSDQAELDGELNFTKILSSLASPQPPLLPSSSPSSGSLLTNIPNGSAPAAFTINLTALQQQQQQKKDGVPSSTHVMQAQYPLMSVADASGDGFYSAKVNITTSVWNGADDAELGFESGNGNGNGNQSHQNQKQTPMQQQQQQQQQHQQRQPPSHPQAPSFVPPSSQPTLAQIQFQLQQLQELQKLSTSQTPSQPTSIASSSYNSFLAAAPPGTISLSSLHSLLSSPQTVTPILSSPSQTTAPPSQSPSQSESQSQSQPESQSQPATQSPSECPSQSQSQSPPQPHSIFDPDLLIDSERYSEGASHQDTMSIGGSSVKGEGVRRAKRRLTDKQRRAKIKEGLEQLRSLVTLHGNSSTDQASIVSSSVDLLQQLVGESKDLRGELQEAQKEALQMQMQMQQAIEHFNQQQKIKQMQFEQQQIMQAQQEEARIQAQIQAQQQQQQQQQAQQQHQQQQQQCQHFLDQHQSLNHALSSLLSSQDDVPSSSNSNSPHHTNPCYNPNSAIAALLSADPSLAESLDQIILSSYFLQTLQLLAKIPKNQYGKM